jgi:hypothetical protein
MCVTHPPVLSPSQHRSSLTSPWLRQATMAIPGTWSLPPSAQVRFGDRGRPPEALSPPSLAQRLDSSAALAWDKRDLDWPVASQDLLKTQQATASRGRGRCSGLCPPRWLDAICDMVTSWRGGPGHGSPTRDGRVTVPCGSAAAERQWVSPGPGHHRVTG